MGYVDDIRLFTTAGFVLTDLDNARAFLQLPSSHVNYIVCKCRPGANVPDVVRQLQAAIPEHDVLTTRQFHDLCSDYWETVSGIGPLILMSSILGVTVGFLIVIMTFYIATMEKIPVYGCLKALGGTVGEIAAILGVQVLIVFLLGSAIAGAAALRDDGRHAQFDGLGIDHARTWWRAGLGTMLACSALGALLSIRTRLRHRPRRGIPNMSNGDADIVLRLEGSPQGVSGAVGRVARPEGIVAIRPPRRNRDAHGAVGLGKDDVAANRRLLDPGDARQGGDCRQGFWLRRRNTSGSGSAASTSVSSSRTFTSSMR